MNLDVFNDIEAAFKTKSNRQLRKALWMFKLIKYTFLVRFGKLLLNISIKIGFPVNWIIKPTIFSHFCGGESIESCDKSINMLAGSNIKTILDYSSEGNETDDSFTNVVSEIIATIDKAAKGKDIPFAVFKMSGIASHSLLFKISRQVILDDNEQLEQAKLKNRVDFICRHAYEQNVPVLIDAEESWIQKAIDDLVEEMSHKYNTSHAIVFNTLQMYRTDRLDYLAKQIEIANKGNFYLGFKLVRGAYIEKENDYASKNQIKSAVYQNKESTDNAFDSATELCFRNIQRVSICLATHNEESTVKLIKLMKAEGVSNNDSRIWFAQLYGMSDHISFNLAKLGYNVAKYMPYGPVKSVVPYLIRRAEENTSVKGQSGRELSNLKHEILRRKSLRKQKSIKN